MTPIEKNIRRFVFGQKVLALSTIGLFLSAAARWLLGLSEAELYEKYPWSWWVVITFGMGFMWSMFYMIKKQYDLHPNIQLRNKTEEYLESIAANPDYEPWHDEAITLIAQRREKRERKEARKKRN